MKIKYFILAVLLLPSVSFASHNCVVTPLVKTVVQGESASFLVTLTPSGLEKSFQLRVGDLPRAVSKGFVETASTTQATVIFSTNADAEVGAFVLTLIYTEDSGGVLTPAYCPLKLSIQERKKETVTSPQTNIFLTPSTGSTPQVTTLSVDALSVIPENLIPAILVLETATSGVSVLPTEGHVKEVSLPSKNSSSFTKKFINTLSYGSKGEEVKRLQDTLKEFGFFPKEVTSTGLFGPITRNAVRTFQKDKHIEPLFGIFGPKTRAVLHTLLGIQ